MLVAGLYHITYCTNIHPGENWESTFESIQRHVTKVKQNVAPKQKFGIGLRLSNKASKQLGLHKKLEEFKNWLEVNGLYIFTMNGFPYGNFHGERVKDKVHTPDWTTKERHLYTLRLFHQLKILLPDGISGGISTSPISYRHWFSDEKELADAKRTGAAGMLEVAIQLHQIEVETGKYLHLDIEPEPDGIIENTSEFLAFFSDYVIPQGIEIFKIKFRYDAARSEVIIKRHLTICYDICHFALAFEEPSSTFSKLKADGIRVGKIQVSAALKILFQKGNDKEIWDSLRKFNEPTYLHQVTEQTRSGIMTYEDLPVVLNKRKKFKELRAHFHVPIFLEQFTNLYSTQDHIIKVLDYLGQHQICSHLEVETYTWDVLPTELKRELSESIIRELNWLTERLI